MKKAKTFPVVSVAALLCLPAIAQAAEPNRAELIDGLSHCRSVTEPQARLACYDQAAATLEAALASKNLVVLDRADVRKTRRSLFGFSLPKLPFFAGTEGEDEPEEITAKAASVRSLGYGKWLIKLEDGAIWQTTETTGAQREPTVGTDITIKRGLMGSYMLKVGGQRAVRAKRQS